jgi:ATP-dependent protease ClpP protease subunit
MLTSVQKRLGAALALLVLTTKPNALTPPLDNLFWNSGTPTAALIKIEGPISQLNHFGVPSEIRDRIADGVTEIHFEINSPGGSVSTMMEIMTAMDQARVNNIKLVCTVTRQAASAAFLIFNHCDKRYAHELSNLMWHSVGVYLDGPYNLVSLRALVSSLEALQYWGNTMIQAQLKLSPEFFSEMWLTELTLTAPQLKALAPHYLEVIPYAKH